MSKILIVEDEISIANMYLFKLSNNGFDTQIASNGKIGLEIAKEWKPDLILLDLMMPVMSGDQMLEKLRSTEWGTDIKVIVLTNISRSEAPSILRYLNVDQYIVKAHTTPSELLNAVKNLLNKKVT